MKFYLGIHQPAWLARTTVPLFVSRVRLHQRKTFPTATCDWALDSGGFSELSKHGKWTVSPEQYVDEVRRFADGIGRMQWAAIQDHMCEPTILAKTRSTVMQHQQRTIANYQRLLELAPDLPWLPVLQGWTFGDYLDHLDMYDRAGINLRQLPIVGVGSICRRSHHMRASFILSALASEGLQLHGFGFKIDGLRTSHGDLASADSMAWSYDARRAGNGEQNSLDYGLQWRADMLDRL